MGDVQIWLENDALYNILDEKFHETIQGNG